VKVNNIFIGFKCEFVYSVYDIISEGSVVLSVFMAFLCDIFCGWEWCKGGKQDRCVSDISSFFSGVGMLS
jgi:hypothetical protein